jgi:hypothetical protein
VRFFINDVGQNLWEEIDEGQAGADYGWNAREGPCPYPAPGGNYCDPASNLPSIYVDPIHYYRHDEAGYVITGGAFVPDGVGWPSEYAGAYMFADGGDAAIYRLSPDGGGGYTRSPFGTGLGYVVHLRFGPYNATQALYYSTGGQVRRVAYSGQPVASASANPTSGPAPLMTTLSAQGSYDPNGLPLTYDWNFGDGQTLDNVASLTVTHTYDAVGVYTATLVAKNGSAQSSPDSVQIQAGNTPPSPAIGAPAGGATFAVGQTITLQGSATDPQDGVLAASRLSWEVRLQHVDSANPGAAHYHPFYSVSGVATSSFAAPAPEDLNATDLSYLEVRLTAADSLGLSTTVTRTLQPRRVTLTFNTQPPGLLVTVNERTLASGGAVTSWQGFTLNLGAPAQLSGGRWWALAPYSLTTPAGNTTYTATFVPAEVIFFPIARK